MTILFNKIDLLGVRDGGARALPALASVPQLRISASTGAGLEELRRHLLEAAGYQPEGSGALSARRRHLEALAATAAHLDTAARQCREAGAGELVAEELRAAQHALGEITGTGTAEELLGRISSAFCIGK